MVFGQKKNVLANSSSRALLSLLSATLCFTSLLLYCMNVAAAVYQYTDKSGKTHFSDKPFQYKQPTVRQENRNRRLRPGWIKTEKKLIVGKWQLFATSASKNGKLKRQRDTWIFNADGSYEALSVAHPESEKLRYYFIAGNIEIRYADGRDSYSVIDLSRKKMVLRLDSNNQYFYFERGNERLSSPGVTSYYGRAQVATIVTLLACGELKYKSATQSDLDRTQKKIFLKTGVVKFNKEKFIASINFYKKDELFQDVYEKKINSNIKRCTK